MAFGSAVNSGHVDGQQNFSIIGVIGTLGTADTSGTSLTLPIAVDPTTGAMFVNNLGASGGGGTNVNVVTGTINSDTIVGGTLQNVNAGTITALATGTIAIGTITGKDGNTVAQTANPVSIGGTDAGGTVRTVLVNSAGAMSVTGASAGTNIQLVNGTLTLGTVVGKDAAAVAATANPFQIAGTDSGGTIRVPLVNAAGALSVSGASAGTFVNIATGTQQTLGTVNIIQNAGTIQGGTINNLVSGTINALASGTITGGTIQNLNSGSIVVTNGTISTGTVSMTIGTVIKSSPSASSGSFTAAGSVVVTGSQYDTVGFDIQGTWVGTEFFEGQIGTSAWFAIPAVNSQNSIVGTQSTTNGDYFVSMAGLDGVRARLTYSSGTQTYNSRATSFETPVNYVTGGSINNIGTLNGGTIGSITGVGVVSNLTNGSIVMTGGTLTTGTLQNLATGTINALASGTITGGTIQNINNGTLASVTTVSNLTNGSVVVTVGTITTGSLTNLANGSVTMTVGTLTTGTLQNLISGTVTALGIGTIIKSSPAPQAGSFTAAGTITLAGSQYDAASFDIQGTWVGTGFFEGQIGTSAWFAVPAITQGGIVGTQTTANGDFDTSMTGLDGVRFRFTFASGTLTYNARQAAFTDNFDYLAGGSLTNVGSLSGIGTLTNIGSITNVGQLYNAGTVQNQLGGTITTVSNITTGSIVVTTGTITTGTLQNLVTGTINALASGTISTGTVAITAGTLSPLPTIANSTFGTHGTTGVSIFGTLAGGTSSGAGTEVFITSLSLTIPSTAGSQDISVGWGTNGGTFHAGTGLIVRGNFVASAGIQKTFWPPVNSGTNGQLTYFQAGAGTVDISVTYFITASTL